MHFTDPLPPIDYGTAFTWHRGSLLRHTSLWHLLHRIVKLNVFSLAEFNRHCSGQGRLNNTTSLIHNRSSSGMTMLDLDRIAELIGEPAGLLKACDVSTIGGWAHDLFLERIRVCTACLRLGYHSSLFGLKVLRTCPIHDLPLLEKCPSGRPFTPDGPIDVFRSVGRCRCGCTPLFSDWTCRRPLMKSSDLAPLDRVASWLQTLSRCVAVPLRSHDSLKHISAVQALRFTEALGIAVPPGAVPTLASPTLIPPRFRRAICGGEAVIPPPTRHSSQYSSAMRRDSPPARIDLLEPGMAVFSALDRYIRRHVVGRDWHYCDKFMMSCDAEVIARLIADSEPARKAWAYPLWMLDVGIPVDRRFRRLSVQTVGNRIERRLRFDGLTLKRTARSAEWTPSQCRWMLMHVAEVVLLNAWRRAQSASSAMARSGAVSWGNASVAPRQSSNWFVAVPDHGAAKFFGAMRAGGPLIPRAGRSKSERVAMHSDGATRRAASIAAACPPYCIKRSSSTGIWDVCEPTKPRLACTGADLKRHRLLGVSYHPTFVLTELPGALGFSARLEAIPLEVTCCTASDAIHQLRDLVRRYIERYGDEKLRASRARQMTVVTPVPSLPNENSLRYRKRLADLLQDWDFWQGGEKFAASHRTFLDDRAKDGIS